MIKAIIFDYFGVISSDEYWAKIKKHQNVSGDFNDLKHAINTGEMAWNEFIVELAKRTGESPQKLQYMYETQKINPELIDYIDKQHKQYKTALLTNVSHGFLDPLIEQTHLNEVFDEIVISSRLGLVKPDLRVFEHTLQALAVKPEESIFIDDKLLNVDAAKSINIQTILYEDFGQMKTEIEKLLADSNR